VTRLTVKGLDQVQRNLKAAQARLSKGFQDAIHATGLSVQRTAQKKIQSGSRSGTIYYRIPGDKYLTIRAGSTDGTPVAFPGGSGVHNLSLRHQASAPGEPPKTDTGGLVSSIAIVLGSMKAQVGTGLDYGKYLEFGTTRMEPRPWLYPSLMENGDTLKRMVAKYTQDATKGT
jgi:hypothetical protein